MSRKTIILAEHRESQLSIQDWNKKKFDELKILF
jgi:hypothetical protein